jgi:nitrogen regulatory protein PII
MNGQEYFLLVIVLNRVELLGSVLRKMDEMGVEGATIVETTGMGRMLLKDFPFYARVRDAIAKIRPHNKTIFAVVRGMEKVEKVAKEIDDMVEFSKPGTGILFVAPLVFAMGLGETAPEKGR